MRRIEELTDSELVHLYREWSEDRYCAGFMNPTEDIVKEFREELPDIVAKKLLTAFTGYEREFLSVFRRLALMDTAYDKGVY